MLTKLLILLLSTSCINTKTFLNTGDYRDFPIAVDCEKPEDVSLNFSKDGLPSKRIDDKGVEFREIFSPDGKRRPICIFKDMTLLEFCQYKGEDEVAPYWVESYKKINAVKCKEVLH